MTLTEIKKSKSFGGDVIYYQHSSSACQCDMTFAVFLPAKAKKTKVPALYFLSGLTCNHENFITKAGAQQVADELGLALIMPDTSPRNVNIAQASESADVGYGAGFYVNATQQPWATHFNMADYIVKELLPLSAAHLPIIADKISIMGHSMGGHGALTLALKNPAVFKSVSAFAPICAPTQCPWGEKAFNAYLGDNKAEWQRFDACALIASGQMEKIPLFIDQGEADPFLQQQLQLHKLEQVCAQQQHPLIVKRRPGYDHSYYYIATFIAEHLHYHAKHLLAD